jgi:hypothetical protein
MGYLATQKILSNGEFRNECRKNRNVVGAPKLTAVQVRNQPLTKERHRKVVLKEERKRPHSQPAPAQNHLPKPLICLPSLFPPCPVQLHPLPHRSRFTNFPPTTLPLRQIPLTDRSQLHQIPHRSLQDSDPFPPLLPAMLVLVPMPDLRNQAVDLQQFLPLLASVHTSMRDAATWKSMDRGCLSLTCDMRLRLLLRGCFCPPFI